MADMRHITVTVNGTKHQPEIESRCLLGDFLRDDFELHSVHFGCGHGVFGAWTVDLNGVSVRSCLPCAVQADGAEITTMEAVGTFDNRHLLQYCLRENHSLQCGFCTPGMIMTIVDLEQMYPLASEEEIQDGISGNLCRCTGYQNIVSAAQEWIKQ